MFKNPSYFNSSLWDTVTGEYFRRLKKKAFSLYFWLLEMEWKRNW